MYPEVSTQPFPLYEDCLIEVKCMLLLSEEFAATRVIRLELATGG